MIKRLLAGFVLAALMSTASACYLGQLWLVLALEFAFPAGVWVKVICVDFPTGPFEIPAGTYKWNGKFSRPTGTTGKFPKQFRYIATGWDANGKRLWIERYTVPLNRKTGEFNKNFTYPHDMVIPQGGKYCSKANFSRPGMPADSALNPINVQRIVVTKRGGRRS